MKLIVAVVLALVAASYAVDPEPVKIVRSEFNQQPEGAYVYGFETANGITRDETGELKDALDEDNKPHQVVVMRGSWTYTDPEGKLQSITYFADETGFHAEGDSVPKEPVLSK